MPDVFFNWTTPYRISLQRSMSKFMVFKYLVVVS